MKPRYLLDTNICIYIAKHNPPQVRERFERLACEALAMSVITFGELRLGAEKSQSRSKSLAVLKQLNHLIQTLPLLPEVGVRYGQIRAALEKLGQPIGNNDLWIAAHALAANLTLITNNEREFLRIPDLKVENWTN